MTNTKRLIVRALPGIAFASLMLLAQGCGGCSSSSSTDTVTSSRSAAQSAAIIESRPVPFDARSLEEMADLIDADTETTPEDRARMLVLAEAGVSNLLANLEDLARNDDPADTFGVMTELATRRWTRSLVTIITYLGRVPLNDTERTRANHLLATLNRARSTAGRLQATQLGGNDTGLPATLSTDQSR